jgi:hypothetical protein
MARSSGSSRHETAAEDRLRQTLLQRHNPTEHELDLSLARLNRAVIAGRSVPYCLRLWSVFIRLRDGHRCVICDSPLGVSAHHVVRKTLFSIGSFQTGNGITVCGECHSWIHRNFNGNPDIGLPMDAEGGERIDVVMDLFRLLAQDGPSRGILREEYYFLSDQLLESFKKFQGIPPDLPFSGSCVLQAHLIWRQTPRRLLKALAKSMEIELPMDFIQGLAPVPIVVTSVVGRKKTKRIRALSLNL